MSFYSQSTGISPTKGNYYGVQGNIDPQNDSYGQKQNGGNSNLGNVANNNQFNQQQQQQYNQQQQQQQQQQYNQQQQQQNHPIQQQQHQSSAPPPSAANPNLWASAAAASFMGGGGASNDAMLDMGANIATGFAGRAAERFMPGAQVRVYKERAA